jgi:hypothetical protein
LLRVLTEPQFAEAQKHLRESVQKSMEALADLRAQLRALSRPIKIQQRAVTTVSLVGTDGGHNQSGINPFLTQFMRVVDSNDQEHCMEVITAHEPLEEIWRKHEQPNVWGRPTPLKHLMNVLEIDGPDKLRRLTPLFSERDPLKRSPSWLQVYRHITEWAVLLQLLESDYASDTLFVWDGPLRTKVFPHETFERLVRRINEAVTRQAVKRGRKYYVVGLVKHSKVLERFRLAMALEGVLRQSFPCYVQLTGDLISEAIDWIEYLSQRERESLSEHRRASSTKDIFSAGQMYFVKFGSRPGDPVWVADIWETQIDADQQIFGYLLNDAQDGFPVPLFPQCLQRAHKYAALVDIDLEVFQSEFGKRLREVLGSRSDVVDELEFQNADPAGQRYE